MKKLYFIYFFIFIFLCINKNINAQYNIESSVGLFTSPWFTDGSDPNIRISGNRCLSDSIVSYNFGLTFYNNFNNDRIHLTPAIKLGFGEKVRLDFYFGLFFAFMVKDKSSMYSSDIPYSSNWGFNVGLNIKIKIIKKLYLLFDYRFIKDISASSKYKEGMRGGYHDYYRMLINPSIGLCYKFDKK